MKKYICKEVQTENGGYLKIEKELILCEDCIHFDGCCCRNEKWGRWLRPKEDDGYCDWAEPKAKE